MFGVSGVGSALLGPELLGPELLGPELLGPELLGPELLGPELLGPELLPPEAEEPLLDAWAMERVVTAGMAYAAAATRPMRRSMLRRSRLFEGVSVIVLVP